MAGIYIHIPFCKSRCIYCGFFSTTSLQQRNVYVEAVLEELRQRKNFLAGEPVDTVYFGGGTPSQLLPDDLEKILDFVHYIYNVREGAEITLEGNPDDMTPVLLQRLRQMGVNRLSMGVQTFDDARLRFLHRRHTAAQTIQAIHDVQEAGFSNISIDLMFGFPNQTLAEWKHDVQKALSLHVQHLSAYSLMYEEGTMLERMLTKGMIAELDEEVSLQMYEFLMDALGDAGYEHYELSNFALPGMRSRHNSSYWHGIPYLGVGAGAHSYNGCDRFYHPDSLEQYIAAPCDLVTEHLTQHERYDEYVFTSLRTSDGLCLSDLEHRFGASLKEYCLQNAQRHLKAGLLSLVGDMLCLTRRGLFISNEVMSDLMWDE
jgi:oxygen-independent coproporphyrinogen-3 oxidase